MKRINSLKKAEFLLRLVLENLGYLEKAILEWPIAEKEDFKLMEAAKWQLIYISNDSDIRAIEPNYETYQLRELESYLVKIRARLQIVIENETVNTAEYDNKSKTSRK